jgi:hypothetical protein
VSEIREPAIAVDQAEPGEQAELKIVVEPLGVELLTTVPERHSAKMVQIAEKAMNTLGPVLVMWVGASTDYPAWVILVVVLVMVGSTTKLGRRR